MHKVVLMQRCSQEFVCKRSQVSFYVLYYNSCLVLWCLQISSAVGTLKYIFQDYFMFMKYNNNFEASQLCRASCEGSKVIYCVSHQIAI